MMSVSMRSLAIGALAALCAALAGCGGGGGGDGGNSMPTPMPTQNTQAVSVDKGPGGFVNILFTSVKLCFGGGSGTCTTIDHVQVDTGSSGLRIIASAIPPGFPDLVPQVDFNGNPIVECAQFVDGFSWGPVKLADVHLAGEVATSMPIQVIGDPRFQNVPASCSNTGPPENTVDTFGANGVLGIGLFVQDCGDLCAQSAIPGKYYVCAAAACQPTRLALAQQLQNPVALFATDNNGVVIRLSAIPATGAPSASGSLIFGIGTQANNATSGVTVLGTDPDNGFITTTLNNQTYATSYIDSGTNLLSFGSNVLAPCHAENADFYCPATTQSLNATMRGTNGAVAGVNFSVANAEMLVLDPSLYAFNDLAGMNSDPTSFAWGLPFFYGRSVYTAIEGRSTPVGPGPYYAF